MKIRILSALWIFVASASVSFSQDVEIHNGAQFITARLEFVETILDASPDKVSFLTRTGLTGNKFRVLNLDGQLNERSKFEIEIPEVNNKKLKYFWSVKLGESVYFMSRYFDSKANDYYLYASELDPSTGKFVRHLEALKVNDKSFKSLRNPFAAVRSIDSTKVLFVTAYPTSANENARYGLKVVNSDMTEIWSKDVIFPHKDKDFSFQDFDVDKDGNIHFVAAIRMSMEERNEKDSKGKYYISIYSYFHETGELKQYDVGFKDEIIRTMDLDFNDKGEMVGTGFYSERKFVDSYKGFFYLRIDPVSKEVVASNLSPFSTELLTEIIGARRAEKGKEMPPYIIRASRPLEDGGMVVVAEHYVYSQNTDQNGQTTEMWLYGNVVVMFINAEGKMETAAVLKKKQLCTAKNGGPTVLQMMGVGMYPGSNELPYYGISIMQHKNDIHILYNDNPKNIERLKAGKNPLSVRQKNSITYLSTVTRDGKVTTTELFKSKDKDAGYRMPLMPRTYMQYSDNDMVVVGAKGKYMRAARITIK